MMTVPLALDVADSSLGDAGDFLLINRFARRTGWLHGAMTGYASIYGVLILVLLLVAGWWLARRADQLPAMAALVWAGLGTLVAVGANQPIVSAVAEKRPSVSIPPHAAAGEPLQRLRVPLRPCSHGRSCRRRVVLRQPSPRHPGLGRRGAARVLQGVRRRSLPARRGRRVAAGRSSDRAGSVGCPAHPATAAGFPGPHAAAAAARSWTRRNSSTINPSAPDIVVAKPRICASLHCYWLGPPPSRKDIVAVEQAAIHATDGVSAAQSKPRARTKT